MFMTNSGKPNPDPLHGKTLESILNELVDYLGWEELGQRIPINCFTSEPSIKSSLKFLRKTPWARTRVEGLYGWMLREKTRQMKKESTVEFDRTASRH